MWALIFTNGVKGNTLRCYEPNIGPCSKASLKSYYVNLFYNNFMFTVLPGMFQTLKSVPLTRYLLSLTVIYKWQSPVSAFTCTSKWISVHVISVLVPVFTFGKSNG